MPCKGKPFKSKLLPYIETIRSMKKGGSSYAEIANALKRDFGIEAHRATIHSFVRARSKVRKGCYAFAEDCKAVVSTTPKSFKVAQSKNESAFGRMRNALKAKAAESMKKGGFDFDETQPIR